MKDYRKLKSILFCFLLFITSHSYAQRFALDENGDRVYFLVDHYPEYPGGVEAMFAYLDSSVQYPDSALENSIEGEVRVKAVIDTNGKVISVFSFDDLEGGLTDEALRVVQNMPNWRPGYMRGMPVKVMVTIPIRFELNDEEEDAPQPKKKHRRN